MANELLERVLSKFGDHIIKSKDEISAPRFIPSGVQGIDNICGGGYPRGRITQNWGAPGGGKTTQALLFSVQVQKENDNTGQVMFIDMEQKLDARFAEALGVDMERFYIIHPSDGNECADLVTMTVKANAVDAIIIDSVAAMWPGFMQDKKSADNTIASISRLLSSWLGPLMPSLYNSDVALLFLNQQRIAIMDYGSPAKPVGGNALSHYITIENWFRQKTGKILGEGKVPIGIRVLVDNKKNQVAPPYRRAEYEFYWLRPEDDTPGINLVLDTFEGYLANGRITREGNTYFLDGEKLAGNRPKSEIALKAILNGGADAEHIQQEED